MSRRPHPYFGRLSRSEELREPEPGPHTACEPVVRPGDEPGILWQAFRKEQ